MNPLDFVRWLKPPNPRATAGMSSEQLEKHAIRQYNWQLSIAALFAILSLGFAVHVAASCGFLSWARISPFVTAADIAPFETQVMGLEQVVPQIQTKLTRESDKADETYKLVLGDAIITKERLRCTTHDPLEELDLTQDIDRMKDRYYLETGAKADGSSCTDLGVRR
jgi:hypothetical protein